MKLNLCIAVALWLAAASEACSQEVRAVINGPKEAMIGDLVALDATESSGRERVWVLAAYPAKKFYQPVDEGRKCLFASGTPGRYVFLLFVAGPDANGKLEFKSASHELVIVGQEPGPGPNPDPTPPPTANPYPMPGGNLRLAANGVAAVKMSREDATILASLYQDASRLVASAQAARAAGTKPEIGTTGELRAWLVDQGRQLGMQGRYPALAGAVDGFLSGTLGMSIRDVSESDAAALAALAWGVWEAGR